ncbi:TetR family transcriptional regulator [Kitasatospora herbaricolor]|uniref:TetR/AcrR family transcriptional regulator n=1 Tax=Kitasatospora herbaricolor TaxID=68217 RepID=UPI00174DAE7F|nr:TetR/AcrR family transcriptional regulator C-terminal domain-containing protein [Kitasatospora herbaricolor]MDQ0306418.1 AcrR family transcriptional regulator [Kitasatospora herbaricolor]GGV42418.1 TetR family transcriptional regulator [Kitasatospora herbaricolor]
MAMQTQQSQRRRQVLSRERIVEAAVELLDAAGQDALTVRAVTERLSTGAGAIYHHVGNMGELLTAATESVLVGALAARPEPAEAPTAVPAAAEEIRGVALALYDAVCEHPWLATQFAVQLTRSPWGAVTPRVFESIGGHVRTLGVPRRDWFAATSTLVHYILGATAQNAQAPGDAGRGTGSTAEPDRAAYLDVASRAWQALDPHEYPFIHDIAEQMREHDDREQFLAGIDLVLAGIAATRPAADPGHHPQAG